jgi:peroxiredoxin
VTGRSREPATARSSLLGSAAPALVLPTLEGGGFDLEDLRGRPVLVCFLRHAG